MAGNKRLCRTELSDRYQDIDITPSTDIDTNTHTHSSLSLTRDTPLCHCSGHNCQCYSPTSLGSYNFTEAYLLRLSKIFNSFPNTFFITVGLTLMKIYFLMHIVKFKVKEEYMGNNKSSDLLFLHV